MATLVKIAARGAGIGGTLLFGPRGDCTDLEGHSESFSEGNEFCLQ
jgi:hypothetical protein